MVQRWWKLFPTFIMKTHTGTHLFKMSTFWHLLLDFFVGSHDQFTPFAQLINFLQLTLILIWHCFVHLIILRFYRNKDYLIWFSYDIFVCLCPHLFIALRILIGKCLGGTSGVGGAFFFFFHHIWYVNLMSDVMMMLKN